MNIIIVGCGKVGYTIAKHLSEESHDIVIVDKKPDAFDKVVESIDVIVVKGNGLTRKTLMDASVKTADLIICVTESDEANVLCCVTAKQLGVKYSVARVRDPEYYDEFYNLRSCLKVDMIINPEQQAAHEISRLLRFPAANDVETFLNSNIELVAFKLDEGNPLAGKTVHEGFKKLKIPVLAAVVERQDDAFIPDGQMILQAGDELNILGRPMYITEFSRKLGMNIEKIKDVMIIGGGKIAYYLAQYLRNHRIKVKIIENDVDRCRKLSEDLPDILIINGDGTDEEVLNAELIGDMGAVVCLSGRDEENIILGMYARQCGVPKTIVKISHITTDITKNLDLGIIACPKTATAYQIISYVRGLTNSQDRSNVKSIFNVMDNGKGFIEALEFDIGEESKCVGNKIGSLKLKKGVLIGCIVRGDKISIPTGDYSIEAGDTAILLSKGVTINEFDDILRER